MTALPPEVLAKQLESAMAKLRVNAGRNENRQMPFTERECTALLAKLEAAERLAVRVDEYLRGEWLGRGLMEALSAYRTPQQEPSNG